MEYPEDILQDEEISCNSFCLCPLTQFMDHDRKKELAIGMEFLTSLELVDPMPNAPLGWAYLPTVRKLDIVQGTSQIRQIILDVVTNNGIRRPPANVLHQRRELIVCK